MTWSLKLCCILSLLAVFVQSGNCDEYSDPRPPGFETEYHNMLLQKLNLLIPNMQKDKPFPQQVQILKNLLNMIRFLALKLHQASEGRENDPKVPQYIALRSSVDEALQLIEKKRSVNKALLNSIANQLAQLFQETSKVQTHQFAPFCEPGNDCFLDVNHGNIDNNLKNLVMKVKDYMKYRKIILRDKMRRGLPKEAINAELNADAILAESTVLLKNLHRSIMRNWHHILMITGNLAGNEGGAIHLLGKPNDEPPSPGNNKFRPRSLSIGSFQCKVLSEGNPSLQINKRVCNSNSSPWFQNLACSSPIKNSESDCSPSFSGGRFVQLQGDNVAFEVDSEGYWNYKLRVVLNRNPNVTQDLVVGRIEKIDENENIPKSLTEINNDVFFANDNGLYPTTNEVVQEGTGFFKPGDKLVLRLSKTRSNISLLFTADLVNSKKKDNSEEEDNEDGPPEAQNRRGNDQAQGDERGQFSILL